MDLKERFEEKKRRLQELKDRGRDRSEQMKAEKKRRKNDKIKNMKPGAKRTIMEGLATRQFLGPIKTEYQRRKYEREKKYHGKSKDSSK